MPLGTTQQFTAIGTYSDGSTQNLSPTVTWTSSTSSATVSTAGLVTAAALGTSTIQASSGSQSSSTTVTVGSPALVSLAVTPATSSLALGLSQQYQAVGTYTDGSSQNLTSSVSWYAVPSTSASVNSTGLVTSLGRGNVQITAVYGGFSGISALTVGMPNLVSITVTPSAASVSVGSSQQFVAVGKYSDGSTQDITTSVSWASSSGTVSTVSTTGLATTLAAGNATITASFSSVTGNASLTATSGTLALNTSRYQHNATLLNNGSVLIAGGQTCPSAGSCTYLSSAELYNPSSGSVTNTGSLATPRTAAAVLLGNGKVLVAGGLSCDSSGNCASLSSAEIYDPGAGTFSLAGNMTAARDSHTMTLLSNGQVLIAGGETCTSASSCTALSSAELYDPIAGTFTATGSLSAARFNAAAVALSSGQVLIAGGFDGANYPASAELFNPATGSFSASGTLNTPRAGATATLLDSGQVMIAGGSTCSSPGCPTAATELYASGSFYYPTYPTGNMNVSRFGQTASLLTNGQVLFTGGFDSCTTSCISDSTTEIFDPLAFTFTYGQSLTTGRSGHTATLLTDGSVLLIGGINNGVTLSTTDIYQSANVAPSGLAAMSISPSDPTIAPGTTVSLSATGYNSSGGILNNSKAPLQSVIWSSSSPSVATVSNASGSAGIVTGLETGTTTISATLGAVTASTDITVKVPLVSIAVSPANPAVTLGSTQPVQLTATGTFSDSSTADLTQNVSWSSSSNAVAMISVIPGSPAIIIPASVGSATITASYGGISGTSTVIVNAPVTPVPPAIIAISPTTGAAGTQVTISGSGFGTGQGGGTVWLGTALGLVASWSDTQIVATVPTGSSSGVVQIQQSNGTSNAVAFTINTAAITGVSPSSGLAGTQVTITGSGFGANQGTGNVWLGTTPGIVSSWSDSRIVATVASGAATGNVQVLQDGVMSNTIPFTINLPHVAGISPNSGSSGTVVTVTGSGFGATQGSGNVWIGSTSGVVVSWSDTQVEASVAANAVSGIVKIQQNGTWSNAVTFTVPTSLGGGGGSNVVALVPNLINMVVGGTQPIEAVDSNGQSITGLTWTSSNTSIVTLSTDDPPIVTAVGVGTATITAGAASADVTVSSGSVLPAGTVIWSNPGDGSGVTSIVPAVPSSTGVADVFAQNASGSVQAITASGQTAWTAQNVSGQIIPDFQGGAVVYTGGAIYRLDGMTGQPSSWNYTSASGNNLNTPVVHTAGTIFTIDGDMLVGINPSNGQTFSIAMEDSTSTQTGSCTNFCTSPLPPSGAGSTTATTPPLVGSLIIAGDGYAYVPYAYTISAGSGGNSGCGCGCYGSSASTQFLRLLRVGPNGDSSEIALGEYSSAQSGYECNYQGAGSGYSASATLPTLITNADQGVLASYSVTTTSSGASSSDTTYYLATTSGTSVSKTQMNFPGQTAPVQPVLQRADGSYVGTVSTSIGNPMIAFTSGGNTLWTGPNDSPQIATSDGGVIGSSGSTYDQVGNVSGQVVSSATQSWTGNEYQTGSVDQISAPLVDTDGSTFWAQAGGNPSANGTSIIECPCLIQGAGTDPAPPQNGPNPSAQNTYVLLVGDPGLNLGIPGHNHNVGNNFNLAAETLANSLSASSNNKVITERVSSVNEFNQGLTTNGMISGGVYFFGHGGRDAHGLSAIFPGEQAGNDAYNITALNVKQLSNKYLANGVSITLNACHAGLGGKNSIAQLMANQLKRTVWAAPVDMFFSSNPNPHFYNPKSSADANPIGVPTYMVPDNTSPLKAFSPQ